MIKQTVNDNSNQKITIKSGLILILSFLKYVRFKKYFSMIKLFIGSFGNKWRKAIFFDKLLHEISIFTLRNKKETSFHTVFFNSLAHIQHHYFYNSKVGDQIIKNPSWYIKNNKDPLLEALKEFDDILNDYLKQKDTEVLIATGLTQTPCSDIQYYWRLKNHEEFLDRLDIKYKAVKPRMTRDFLIEFDEEEDLLLAHDKLNNIYVNNTGNKIFGEIDNRGKSLFVVLDYSHDLTNKIFNFNDLRLEANNLVTFVAIKNGKHDPQGFIFFTDGLKYLINEKNFHVSNIFNIIKSYFLKDTTNAM